MLRGDGQRIELLPLSHDPERRELEIDRPFFAQAQIGIAPDRTYPIAGHLDRIGGELELEAGRRACPRSLALELHRALGLGDRDSQVRGIDAEGELDGLRHPARDVQAGGPPGELDRLDVVARAGERDVGRARHRMAAQVAAEIGDRDLGLRHVVRDLPRRLQLEGQGPGPGGGLLGELAGSQAIGQGAHIPGDGRPPGGAALEDHGAVERGDHDRVDVRVI
jgi:hypothetical protein